MTRRIAKRSRRQLRSATQLLWPLLGSPVRDDCEPSDGGPCWLCGAPWERGQLVERWSGANFTGQNRVRSPVSRYVCEPCVQVCSRVAPVPGRPPKPGKKFGGNYRNYTHLYDAARYSNHSKGEKPAILDWLRATKTGPWFGAVADSGQKHVLPWAPVNPPGTRRGVVLFDESVVELPDADGWLMVDDVGVLLGAGATKAEVHSGKYTARAWRLCGRDLLDGFEDRWGSARGGSWFRLAVWVR